MATPAPRHARPISRVSGLTRNLSARWSSASSASGLLTTLSSPATRNAFSKFLLSEYAEASLLFYCDVEAFELRGDPVNMDEARRIQDMYVAPSGEHAVNVSATVRKGIESAFASVTTAVAANADGRGTKDDEETKNQNTAVATGHTAVASTVFAAAKKAVFKLMAMDS